MKRDISVDYVIYKLNEAFHVIHISNELVTANNISEAKNIHSNRDFDRVPIRSNGKIISYYDSNTDSEIKIEPEEIICGCTGIFEILSYLSKRTFYFVKEGDNTSRIVHYSDLNNPLVPLGIFAQITYCEIAIRNFARSKNHNNLDYGEQFLNTINNQLSNSINVKRAKKQFDDKKKSHRETDLFDELYFEEELILFREIINSNLDENNKTKFKNFINLEDVRIESMKNMRNEVMHSKPEIIKANSDIIKWLNFLQDCQTIISVIYGKTVFQ